MEWEGTVAEFFFKGLGIGAGIGVGTALLCGIGVYCVRACKKVKEELNRAPASEFNALRNQGTVIDVTPVVGHRAPSPREHAESGAQQPDRPDDDEEDDNSDDDALRATLSV